MNKVINLAKLRNFFSSKNRIELAYLHGSFLTGLQHEESDLDIALYLNQKADYDFLSETINAMEDILESKIDLGLLNDSSPVFAYQVLTKGKLIFERNQGFKDRYFIKVVNEYFDLKYYRDIQEKKILEGKIFA